MSLGCGIPFFRKHLRDSHAYVVLGPSRTLLSHSDELGQAPGSWGEWVD